MAAAPIVMPKLGLCDHRAIDGADAARFLALIVGALEHPFRLLIQRA
jgi:pyruvate dehydrogenase E2 component (dihydrolipoamide acetyltransferase)